MRALALAAQVLSFGAWLALAGCASVATVLPGGQGRVDWAQMLAYAERVHELPAEDLTRRRAVEEQAASEGRDANASVRLALLLTAPRAPSRDAGRARDLVAAHLGVVAGGGGREAAEFLLDLMHRHASDGARLGRAESALEKERERLRRLERQLQALKAIERGLDEREDAE